ncbi:MAG: tetratricopeptide repeat protein [Chthoniobacterales bacterium]
MKNLNRYLTLAVASSLLALLSPSLALADEKGDAYKYGKEGIEAAKAKQWDKAIESFEKAAKADPKEANNYNNLGLAYKGAGKMKEAIKAFSDGLAAEPDNTASHINRGVVYSAEKNYDQAIADFDKAISLNSGSIAAYRYRAFAYLQKKEYKKAIEDYNVVLKEKDDPSILDRRAFAYWNLKEYDKAIEDFSKIIKDKPKGKEGYLDRSYVYELKGDYVKGIADTEKVLSMDPGNQDAKSRKDRLEYHVKKANGTPSPTPRTGPRRMLPPTETPKPNVAPKKP